MSDNPAAIKSETDDTTDLRALEAFLVDNNDLVRMEKLLAGFNLFEAIGAVRREERHSDFLAFLLNPDESHGFGDAVLRGFVLAALDREAEDASSLRKIDAALLDFGGARVERERNNIDLLVTCEPEKFVLLIENKVDTEEHSNQLARYFEIVRSRHDEYKVLPVYLTRDGHAPSHPAYHPVSYGDVHQLLEDILESHRSGIAPDVEAVVRHYVQMLERHIMDDSEIAVLARRIYTRHRHALDIIFEYRPDDQEAVKDAILELIEQEGSVRLAYDSKIYVDFVPRAWDELEELRLGGDGTWAKQTDLLRFQFKNLEALTVHLIIGPGKQECRHRLFEITMDAEHKKLFKHRTKQLSGRFSQIWRETVYTKAEGSELSVEEKVEKFSTWWSRFVRTKLVEFSDHFADVFIGAGEGS